MLQHGKKHRRNAAGIGASFATDDLQGFQGIESDQRIDGATLTERGYHETHTAENMEERNDDAAAQVLSNPRRLPPIQPMLMTARCERTAPLGKPVVPDV